MKTKEKSVVKILENALKEITSEKYFKWGKGEFFFKKRNKICACAYGFIAHCSSAEKTNDLHKNIMLCLDQSEVYRNATSIARKVGLTTTFNDKPETTKKDIIAKFKKAITLAKKKCSQ